MEALKDSSFDDEISLENKNILEVEDERNLSHTRDGSLNRFGKPAAKAKTGRWRSGMLLLGNQALSTLAFVGVEVNLVLFSKRVLKQTNEEAANTFSRWMGSVNLFSLIGAFLSDSYMGRYLTCVIFQIVFVLGLLLLSISTHFYLIKPQGCGKMDFICNSHSTLEQAMFYISIYLIAVGNGAYEPCLVTFGADQFDEEDEDERKSKASFFKYFYVALNLGSMFSETVLAYFQNLGKWEMGFWLSSGCALFSFVMLLTGSSRYRYFKPNGNPLSRFSQVIVASVRKMNYQVPLHGEGLHELQTTVNSRNGRRILHTDDFKWLDRAAIIPHEEIASQSMESTNTHTPNPWYLCTVSQVEEVKCVIRLVPVWLCTVIFSMIFIQMLSLFVEQGAAMNILISSSFHIPPASMTVFDIICISCFIILYDRFLVPLYTKITGSKPVVLSELQRIGIGLIVAVVAIFSAGLVELQRLKYSSHGANNETSSLSIFWQIPQYILLGVAEAFVYVGELEFFAAQTPDGLKSLGIGLSMASTAIGSYLSSLLLTVVMEVTSKHGHSAGWVPPNLNDGHLHRFFFLSAGITSLNLVAFVVCAKRFKCISFEKRESDDNETVEEVMA